MFKAIAILLKANYKIELKSVRVFILNLLTPIIYPVVFVIQIFIMYKINPHAFFNLPQELFIVGMFAVQVIFWASNDRSMRFLTLDILSANFDLVLLKPVNLFFYKYFRHFDMLSLTMIILNLLAFMFTAIHYGLDAFMIGKSLLLIVCVSLLYLNLKCIFYGFTFFARDARQISRIHRTLEDLTWMKPPEIFPAGLRTFLTYLLPYIVVTGFIFELLRSHDTTLFWIIIISWLIISALLNTGIWKLGLKRYESMG